MSVLPGTAVPNRVRRIPQLDGFRARCEEIAGEPLRSAAALHRFSVTCPDEFWRLLLDWSGLVWEGVAEPVRTSADVEQAAFFPGIRLNYAENLLRRLPDAGDDAPALTSVHRDRPAEHFTRGQLRAAVGRTAAALGRLGVGVGDRVVAVVPNSADAAIVALAVAARGATLATASPEMGPATLTGRFGQVEPVVALVDRAAGTGGTGPDDVPAALAALPTVAHLVVLDDLPLPALAAVAVHRLADLRAGAGAADTGSWPRPAFDAPLWVMFSSGTTGPAKAMVHGAGGSLLEHVKEHRLHGDLGPGDTLYFHTTTAWMMWHWQLSALAVGAHVVLYDGPVDGAATLWELVAEHRVTVFGTSPAYLQLGQDSGYRPAEAVDLRSLRTVLSTGAVLHNWQYDWVADAVGAVPLQSISGGSDIVGCFVLGHPDEPVRPGRASSLSLGLDVAALDQAGRPVLGEVGELVCRSPFPSRPIGFLQDADGRRFHDAYFAAHPGAWTHGDLVDIDVNGSARLHGRCDGVLNVDGVRIGPSEIYTILRQVTEVRDALAVEHRDADVPGASHLVLLVVLAPGAVLDDALRRRIRSTLRREGSPAHVPSLVLDVAELPYTHNGKRSEVAVRAALDGDPAPNVTALRNPGCLSALTDAVRSAAEPGTAGVAADGGDVPAVVARVVRGMLRSPGLDGDANFFDAGGTSRQSMTVLRRLRVLLDRPVSMETFLADPTIDGLSRSLTSGPVPADSPLELMRAGDPAEPPLFLVHGVYGDVDSYRYLVEQLTAPGAVYGLCDRLIGSDGSPRSIAELADLHVATVTSARPEGPLRLAGYSFGGHVAFEMARRLTAAGRTVEFLGLLDPAPPTASQTPAERRLATAARRIALFLPDFSQASASSILRGRLRTPTISPEGAARRRAHRVAGEHRWGPYAGEVTYFRAARRVPVITNQLFAWRRVAPRLTVIGVPGAHHDLLAEQHAPRLAQRLSAALPLPAG